MKRFPILALVLLGFFQQIKAQGPPSETEVYCYLVKIGVLHPKVVLKQAIYETGHFKSRIFKVKNNLFGFRRTKSYLKFDSWQASANYYKKWQDKYYSNQEEDYFKFLQRKNYAGVKSFNYAGNLKKIKIRGNLNCPDSSNISLADSVIASKDTTWRIN